jgi:hypothetical protein
MTGPITGTPFWVSWYHRPDYGPFELHAPWWTSGGRLDDGADTICAAVMATDRTAARAVILDSYDTRPAEIEWRFTTPQESGWSPFCDRFERADWMTWPTDGRKVPA